jgi:hypothetical protein
MPKSDSVGRKWLLGVGAVLVVLGVFFAAMILVRPFGSPGWLWGFALLLYMPFVLVGAAIPKYVVLITGRLRRGMAR